MSTIAADPVLAYAGYAQQASQQTGVPAPVLLGLIHVESGGNLNAVSSAGAFGATQFEPATAAQYGVKPGDARSQVFGAARYLVDLGYHSDPRKALNAYNGAQTIDGAPNPYADHVIAAAHAYGGKIALTANPTTPASSSAASGGVLAGLEGAASGALVYAALILGGAAIVWVGLRRAGQEAPA